MGLTATEQKTLDYCRQARTSEQVAGFLGIELNSAYKPLRSLQRLGLLEKVAEHANSKAIYQAADLGGKSIGRQLDELVASSQGFIKPKGPQAHNPFNL
jgi:DNA-binding PadR family transcriptional regulator